MRTWNWVVTAILLLSLSSFAQQSAAPQASQQPSPSQTSRPTQPNSQPHSTPTTMNQVVDRFVEREHDLMKMLEKRNPVVESYLQNLTLDPALGPVPKADHYFLGRMDLGESVDRTDYLKDESM